METVSHFRSSANRRSSFALRRALAFSVALLSLSPSALPAATITATLDHDTVSVGDTAVLTLQIEGGEPKSVPSFPAIPNLQVSGPSTSRQVSIVNGQVSSTFSFNYTLAPTQPGEFNIPALQANVDGQTLTSQPLKLKVTKPETAPADKAGDQLAFMKLVIPKKEVYVGEVLQVELQVYIRDGIYNGEHILQNFDAYTGSPVKAEGCSVLKTGHMQRRRARAGNGLYNVATLVTAVSPLKTGPLTVASIDVNLVLQLPLPGRRRDPFDPFGSFFGPQVEEKRVLLSAPPESLTALPLPKENMPANFNGAVGSYSMAVSAGPTNVAMGDPVTVKIQVSGRGSFDTLALPEQNTWRDFKTFPPTAKVDTSDALGLQGTKTFEQVVVPQNAEMKELPSVSFSFFDPDQKSYRTLTQPAIALVVRPSGSAPAPTIVAPGQKSRETPPAQDIVHIKTRLGALAQAKPPLIQQSWFVALQAVPVIALVSAVLWRKRVDKLANNPRLRRQIQVAHIVEQGLTDLRQLAAANKSDEFFATLFRLLQEQLGERLDLPATAITEAVIEEQLRPRKVSESTLVLLQELFQTCNLARFAPIKSSQELAAIIPKFESVLRAIQSFPG